MKLNRDGWPVYIAERRQAKIDPKPPWQRGPVWSQATQQLFIDSILRGYDIPKLYLRLIADQPYEWEIIDGKQRLSAIWQFIQNAYPLSDDSDQVSGHHLAGKRFAELDDYLQEALLAFNLAVVVVEDAEDDEIEDMFLRLQNGVPLNSAEKRNAVSGQVRDFIREVAESHKLMTTSVAFKNARYAHDEVVAQMLLIELTGGPTSIRHDRLKKMYEAHRAFKVRSVPARKLKRVMNFLSKALPKRTPELNKVNVVSLYTIASESLSKYTLAGKEKVFGEWFLDFERRRDLQDELKEEERDDRMVSYELAINQQTANTTSQNERRRVLVEDLLAALPDLALLDERRLFTEEQRNTIFRRAQGKCANPQDNSDCAITCELRGNWHADHIVPHAKGGPTSVENGQLLCASCNQKKSDN